MPSNVFSFEKLEACQDCPLATVLEDCSTALSADLKRAVGQATRIVVENPNRSLYDTCNDSRIEQIVDANDVSEYRQRVTDCARNRTNQNCTAIQDVASGYF